MGRLEWATGKTKSGQGSPGFSGGGGGFSPIVQFRICPEDSHYSEYDLCLGGLSEACPPDQSSGVV